MRGWLLRLAMVLTASTATSLPVDAQATTTLVSVDSAGVHANGTSDDCWFCADGRYVAFRSYAGNLVSNDTNGGMADIFVRDRQAGTTECVSVSLANASGNGHSKFASISADGRYVAFESEAGNLVLLDTNGVSDIFVRDRQDGRTTRVSTSATGAQGDAASFEPSISDDGALIAFATDASNLVLADVNGRSDIVVRDRQSDSNTLASVSSGFPGVQGNGDSLHAALSGDGRCVAFISLATNFVQGDTNAVPDVFVRDLVQNITERVNVSSAALEANDAASNYRPSISIDGRFVAFSTNASNLGGDANLLEDVFVRDRQSTTTELISLGPAGSGNAWSAMPALSRDGRYVAFTSAANDLVLGDTNATTDVFVRDRSTSTTERVSVDSSGAQSNGASRSATISRVGRWVAFVSNSADLAPADANSTFDVFVRDRGFPPPTAYCTAGTTTHGCVPAISSSGTPSASNGSGFTITAGSLEGQRIGLLFYGVDNSGFAPLAWGASSSWLCVKGPTQRTGRQDSGGTLDACDGSLSIDWNAFVAANPGALGAPFAAGRHVFAQCWFRDPPSPKTTMLSNALVFVVEP